MTETMTFSVCLFVWRLTGRGNHPRADEAPEGGGFLIAQPLNELMQGHTGCRLPTNWLRNGGLIVHKVHQASTDGSGIGALLVGSAARSEAG